MLEILLSMIDKRKRDPRLLVDNLLLEAPNPKNIIDLPINVLEQALGHETAQNIQFIKDLMTWYFEPDIESKVTLSSPDAVSDFIIKESMTETYSEKRLCNYLKAEIGAQSREFFMVVCLNSSNQVIQKKILFAGTIDQAQVYPREILKFALVENASALILVHNHPSGNANPSDDDLTLTTRLENMSRGLGLRVHDHIVVTRNTAFSIKGSRFL
ncbi:hypothetical protein EON78_04395 [bacterium]|nr:MAG: hypothetical protein EON78_04395 [bacterium]